MDRNIAVWAFRWAPIFAQGLVRDLRVRWALREAGVPYEVRLVDFDGRHADDYRQLSPFGQVPAVQIDGGSLFESGAILYRLAESSDQLMPADAEGRSNTLVWMFAALNTVERPVNALASMDNLHGAEQWARLRRPGLVEETRLRLSQLAGALQGRDYLVGRFTAADILMASVLRSLRHTDLVAGYPVLDRYLKRCEARPAFQEALDEQMADFARNAPVAA